MIHVRTHSQNQHPCSYFAHIMMCTCIFCKRGCHGRDGMIVEFTTTCAISLYYR